MEYIIVGIGGALGSITRYRLGRTVSARFSGVFPLATFLINITGAILLGMVSNIGFSRNLYLLMADGFLGAYTTFSTFMYEGFNLFRDQEGKNAALYISGSLVLGIVGFLFGSWIAGFLK